MIHPHLASVLAELVPAPADLPASLRCPRDHGQRSAHLLALELDRRPSEVRPNFREEIASCPLCHQTLDKIERWLALLDHPRPIVAPEILTRQTLHARLFRLPSHEERRAAVLLDEEYHHWGLCRLLIDQTKTAVGPPLPTYFQEHLAALLFEDDGFRRLFVDPERAAIEGSPASLDQHLRAIAQEEVSHLLTPQARTALGFPTPSAVELSELALLIASRLEIEIYGTRHVADLRAWAHALHAAALELDDQSELASDQAQEARHWLSEGTGRDIARARIEDLHS